MQLHQLLKILPGELVNPSTHARQNGVAHELGIAGNGLSHDDVLLPSSALDVALHHRLKHLGEVLDEEPQDLGVVEAHDVVHEVEHQLAEPHGGETEIYDAAVVDEVAEVGNALVLHVNDDGCKNGKKKKFQLQLGDTAQS